MAALTPPVELSTQVVALSSGVWPVAVRWQSRWGAQAEGTEHDEHDHSSTAIVWAE